MNKQQAIDEIKKITGGNALPPRELYIEEIKGEIAKDQWHNTEFKYGMEYGYILGLTVAFGITVRDLK